MAGALGAGPAQAQGVSRRWYFEMSGADGAELGDLRLQGTTGRIVLARSDSAFQPLQQLRLSNDHIAFVLARGHLVFEGTVNGNSMSGTVRGPAGFTSDWHARALDPSSTQAPVPPRVSVRQLAMGTDETTVRVAGNWTAVMPSADILEREYRELADALGIPTSTGSARADRSLQFALGFDAAERKAAAEQGARIAANVAIDTEFRSLFDAGRILDLHDAAISRAPRYRNGFSMAAAAKGLQLLGELREGSDSLAVREAAWHLWNQLEKDSAAVIARVDALERREGITGGAVMALIAGYEEEVTWWRSAVRWLLTTRWLETAEGWRSPAQLMARFWGVDSLPLPELHPVRYGDAAAMPIVSALQIGPRLVKPGNAVAVEWLAGPGMRDALDAWRPLRWGEIPLTVENGGRSETVVSPSAQGEVRPAAFFGDRTEIRIDPGINPFAAVATFLHEWHHLIAAERRLSGNHPSALDDEGVQLRLREDNPWLAEGFAEWATEETLRPAGGSAALLRFGQAEKRLGIAARDPEDPHVLGYRLIRAASSGRSTSALRDLLVANLHDIAAVERGLKLGGPSRQPLILHRPANAAVIPGVSFTWVEGTVFNLARRLVIPKTHLEH